MTTSKDERSEDLTGRPSRDWPGVERRPLLKALTAGAALSAGSGVAAAQNDDDEDDDDNEGQVDQPEGFEVEVIVPHATFPDDVAAAFAVAYDDGPKELEFVLDASTVVIARGTFEPGGSSGWHIDQGPAMALVAEGEVDVTFEGECVTRTYATGEAIFATGRRADNLENASDEEQAVIYVIFFNVPDGEPASNHVEPPDC